MRTLVAATAFLCAAVASLAQSPAGSRLPPPATLPVILQRLGQESEAFRRLAGNFISEETLEQKSRPDQPGSAFETREVVSEYGFAGMTSAPNAIHEMRKVITVDGKQVVSLAKARQAMTLGLISSDDKQKKRLLEELEKHGLHGAATDFGQIILLFSARHQKDYTFEMKGERQIGADRLLVLSYTQKAGDTGVTVFLGNAAKREPVHGEISIRKKDLVPLRITMFSTQTVRDVSIREESTVDYKYDPAGTVLPVNIVHRELVQDVLQSENNFSYGPFRQVTPGALSRLQESPIK